MEAVHAGVFPFNGKGAFVDDVVESYHDFLEVDITAPNGAEVPEAAWVCEVGMAAEDAYGTITVSPPCVFHVHVVDAVSKSAYEEHVVDTLIAEVRWIIVEAKALVAVDSLDGAFSGYDVEGDLSRVNFEGEVDIDLFEDIEDRGETLGEVIKSCLQIFLAGRWE